MYALGVKPPLDKNKPSRIMAPMKRCFREPIPEIYDSARYLDAGVSAHMDGQFELASELFQLANNPKVWDWTDSIWGKASPYVSVNKQPNPPSPGQECHHVEDSAHQ